MNNHGHSDWSGLFFLLLAGCIGAALVEGKPPRSIFPFDIQMETMASVDHARPCCGYISDVAH